MTIIPTTVTAITAVAAHPKRRNRGRITNLITSGKLFNDAGLAPLEACHDRVMICGSPALVHDTRALLLGKGFSEGNHGEPGQFVVEKAFAER